MPTAGFSQMVDGNAIVELLGIGCLVYYFIARKKPPEEGNRIMNS
jgi:hypothetical protein